MIDSAWFQRVGEPSADGRRTVLIGIDGELGAGKTTFAEALSRQTGIRCLHLDDYLDAGRGVYVDALDFRAIDAKLKEREGPVIVEGVCLLDTLARLGLVADVHYFLQRPSDAPLYPKNSPIVNEVRGYLRNSNARYRADERICMPFGQTNQLDVDIAYIKAKTIVSALLALGGIAAIFVGAFVLSAGIQAENSAVIRVMGAEVNAKGVGGVILASSVLWGYFAYLARPKYSRRKESRSNVAPDGSRETYEFESSTMAVADPPRGAEQ